MKRPSPVFAGVPVANLTLDETLAQVAAWLQEPDFRRMAVVNAAILLDVERDAGFQTALATADLVTADGMSVVWAARWLPFLGGRLVARVAAPEVMEGILAWCAHHGQRIYLLGATGEVVTAVCERLQQRFPTLPIAGAQDGYFPEAASATVAAAIRSARADVLFVAMGSPRQELWLARYGPQTGVRFALGVGGYFDILAGKRKRAPRWMQSWGLEWSFRLVQEPRRLWRRYLIGNLAFLGFLRREQRRAADRRLANRLSVSKPSGEKTP
ncbi:WecB/TagA/CpsF family glycosyltransferase [Chloracidobacterium thermophilum]|uniref:WecB/TagA/CpsF family glycosyltransferase n=1 Tax=Chloracidobacterium thermophilum TaxID=458033 RepID=UPI0007388B37|nr:WecB/TagA/CpsF family glycosyltransferase [Chloracidobacterium thermophilum]